MFTGDMALLRAVLVVLLENSRILQCLLQHEEHSSLNKQKTFFNINFRFPALL